MGRTPLLTCAGPRSRLPRPACVPPPSRKSRLTSSKTWRQSRRNGIELLRLATISYRAGAGSSADLSEATLALAEARLRVAGNKPFEVLQNLEIIEEQLAELLRLADAGYQAGATGYTSASVEKANMALTDAKARVYLYKAVVSQTGADFKQSVDAVGGRPKISCGSAQGQTEG